MNRVVVILHAIFVSVVEVEAAVASSIFTAHPNVSLPSSIRKEIEATTMLECIVKCIPIPDCFLVEWLESYSSCSMTVTAQSLNSNDLTAAAGSTLFVRPLVMFHGSPSKYSLTCESAKQRCKEIGSEIASVEIVEESFRKGFSLCAWCWVVAADGTCRRSLVTQPPGNIWCGSAGTNIQNVNPNSVNDVLCMASFDHVRSLPPTLSYWNSEHFANQTLDLVFN